MSVLEKKRYTLFIASGARPVRGDECVTFNDREIDAIDRNC